MNTFVALLRGINVGGNNLLPMKSLQTTLGALGCEQVHTYIQTGNVVFQHLSDDHVFLGEQISGAIQQEYGFKPQVMFFDAADFDRAVANNPFSTEVGKALHFYFMAASPQEPDLKQVERLKADSESFHLTSEVFYLWAPDGVGRSELAAKVESCLGVPVTARNWNTVNKIMQMMAAVG